jgi:hypothetical protein
MSRKVLIEWMGFTAIRFHHEVPLPVGHVAIAGRPGPSGSVRRISLSSGQPVCSFHICRVPQFEWGGSAIVHLHEHLGEQAPPAMTRPASQVGAQPHCGREPALGGAQDDV